MGHPQVQATTIEQPKIVQNEEQPDGSSVTGVRGIIQDTITGNGKPVAGVKVNETDVSKTTVNGVPLNLPPKEGDATTNNAGQVRDVVGLLAPARSASEDKPLVQALSTQAVRVTNTNTITSTMPNGTRYSATSTRVLTNIGPDGKVMPRYTLTPTQPVVRSLSH